MAADRNLILPLDYLTSYYSRLISLSTWLEKYQGSLNRSLNLHDTCSSLGDIVLASDPAGLSPARVVSYRRGIYTVLSVFRQKIKLPRRYNLASFEIWLLPRSAQLSHAATLITDACFVTVVLKTVTVISGFTIFLQFSKALQHFNSIPRKQQKLRHSTIIYVDYLLMHVHTHTEYTHKMPSTC